MLKSLRIITTYQCNAYKFKPAINSHGVCRFCYRHPEVFTYDKKTIDKLLSRIRENKNITELVFTGGEPLIAKYIKYLIKSSNSFYTVLHTNGLLLNKIHNEIEYLNCISLPFDGSSKEIFDYYRGDGYYDLWKVRMGYVLSRKIEIGFNTLITPYNLKDIFNIAAKVNQINPKYWFVKKYRHINIANENKDISKYFELDSGIFDDVIKKIRHDFPQINLYSTIYKGPSIPTLFILLNGKAYTALQDSKEYIYLGNIINDGWDRILNNFIEYKNQENWECK